MAKNKKQPKITHLPFTFKSYVFTPTYGGHLGYWVTMMLQRQTDGRVGILMVDLLEKVYSYMILGALVQKLIFQDGTGGHLGFGSTLCYNIKLMPELESSWSI